MATVHAMPVSAPPMPAVSRILARYDRPQLAAFIEIAIGLLDTVDGPDDPDEPDFQPRSDGLPGVPDDHEPGGDNESGAYAEWTTLTASQRRAGSAMINSCRNEDDELDGDETDGVGAEDEECAWFRNPQGFGPGCTISDSDREDSAD